MRKFYHSLLLLSTALVLCFACEENPSEPEEPPAPPEPLVLEGYYIGHSDYEEYTYRTQYLHIPSMSIRDTFYVMVDTAYMTDPDTIEVRKLEGDSLYVINWRHGDRIYPDVMGPSSPQTEEELLRGPAAYHDYDYKLRFSMYGFGTDSLKLNYEYETKFQLEIMADVKLSFRTVSKEPID